MANIAFYHIFHAIIGIIRGQCLQGSENRCIAYILQRLKHEYKEIVEYKAAKKLCEMIGDALIEPRYTLYAHYPSKDREEFDGIAYEYDQRALLRYENDRFKIKIYRMRKCFQRTINDYTM